MPSASATYPRSRRSTSARSGRPAGVRAAGRVRWDRLGRIAMLFVLLALVFLYIGTGFHMLSTWRQAHHTSARVTAMEREHRRLIVEHNRLSSQSNLEQSARALGMQRPGEQSYIVTGLPND